MMKLLTNTPEYFIASDFSFNGDDYGVIQIMHKENDVFVIDESIRCRKPNYEQDIKELYNKYYQQLKLKYIKQWESLTLLKKN